MTTPQEASQTSNGNTYRSYFEDTLWNREGITEQSLDELNFQKHEDGAYNFSNGVEGVTLTPGVFARSFLPSGNRIVLLGTRFGAIGIHEYFTDKEKTKKNLTLIISKKLAHFRLVRACTTFEDQLKELVMVFGSPKDGIPNLHDYLEELFQAVIEVM